MKNARRKFEIPMPAAMPCEKAVNCRGETCSSIRKRKTKYACIVDADESLRIRFRIGIMKITSLQKEWIHWVMITWCTSLFQCLKFFFFKKKNGCKRQQWRTTWENPGMAADESQKQQRGDRWRKEWRQKSSFCVVDGSLSSQEFGVRASKIKF